MKKKSMILNVITIIVVFVLITSATYAFFTVGNLNVTNVANLNTGIPESRATFTAYSNDQINLSVGLVNMVVASSTPVANSTGNLIVNFKSPIAGQALECTYDIQFIWDSTDQYISPSMSLTANYPYELSIAATASASGDTYSSYDYTSKNVTERDLSTLSWTGTQGTIGRKATVVSEANIYSNTVAGTTVTWNFIVNFYTTPGNQNSLLGKSLLAHLSAANINC